MGQQKTGMMKHSLGGDNWKKMDDNQWDFTLIFPKIKHLEYLFITSGKRKSKKKHFEGENLWYLHKKKMSGKRLLQRKQSLMLPHWKKKKKMLAIKIHFGITGSVQVWKITACVDVFCILCIWAYCVWLRACIHVYLCAWVCIYMYSLTIILGGPIFIFSRGSERL